MSTTSLQNKTVRPGSLIGYSYYHSNRRIPVKTRPAPQLFAQSSNRHLLRWGLVAALVVGIVMVAPLMRGGSTPTSQSVPAKTSSAKAPTPSKPSSVPVAVPAKLVATNHCAGNKDAELILVSIGQRHLWACQGSQPVYDSAVITGMTAHTATLTPSGTYHIYAKHTDVTLTGSDVTGSWNDPVQYWMPFLDNTYGTYGFHDATWRANNAFGNISPNSSDASHGCVELPLATSKWLYDWAHVGTTVTIDN